ncbi:hypothetical protein PV646_21945 [Streptomyces sp. ID05-26A]|uniref:Uncharacterized protein n=1 Tax=Lentzea albidocapillata subsp. violacea TaxID=128104 RepID=A0A1G8QTJ5_9PSEU|nr:hypothetical protein [Lentzea albidocapillata]MDX3659971.1 hypothetical protein [Streptomyces sp. ID05-26A]SDJ07933.1 hypothetical protein SAMN04488074_101451 [Lentzea albidocapillata subsp. violacea]
MRLGVQFRGQVPGGTSRRWFTHSWPEGWRVVWMVVPTWPMVDGGAQIEWKVQVDRQAAGLIKYFIEIRNLTGGPVDIEARFAVLN